jgi:hypothetical protein
MKYMQDLPHPAVRSIIQRARARCIPGSNRFALVCRAWRDAGAEDDEDQLQLLLDLDNLKQADLESSMGWLQRHGTCVTGLSMDGIYVSCWPVMEQLLVAPCMHLTSLALVGQDTLLPLAPHLQQLPSLRHLRASICHGRDWQGQMYWGHQKKVADPPDLGQLCPGLHSLHLTLDRSGCSEASDMVHTRLSCLLPAKVQQLHLTLNRFSVDAALFTCLTAVRHLTLDTTRLEHKDRLHHMTQLQQLEIWRLLPGGAGTLDVALLASKLVGLWNCGLVIPATALAQLTSLRALALPSLSCITWSGQQDDRGVNPLLSLTSLRHVQLGFADRGLLAGLSSLSSLRRLGVSLQIAPEMLELVGQVTQLTALDLWLPYMASDEHAVNLRVLQQLTSLQHLLINQAWLPACSRQLGSLQQVTQLVVRQGPRDPAPPVEEVLAPLQRHSGSLQHVLFIQWLGHSSPVSWYGQPPQEVLPSPLPGVRVTISSSYKASGLHIPRQRSIRPCPHLPGVWELQPEVV